MSLTGEKNEMPAADAPSAETAPSDAGRGTTRSHSEIQALLRSEIEALRQSLDDRIRELVALTDQMENIGAGIRAEADAEIADLKDRHAVELILAGVRERSQRDGTFEGVPAFQHQIDTLGDTELFDPAWYLEVYADVRESGISPKEHYVRSGAFEGRDPGPHFSTMSYYMANPDVAQAGWPALAHYVAIGKADGRPLS
ncbi:hypothetical protein [Jannaschia sp. M317]|uniref:hypothetical protein n=1 Tax=Jannaschia sp. M317 TaxID=2867011 RepID=UPI0021A5AE9D|nr:hypothetical protein [Jannaschia sp. M317]UWQ19672.1 hypothetical protein K3551_18135 [Jannaschia sp. M317]